MDKKQAEHERMYIAYLDKKLKSENWRKQATSEEIETTKRKLDKARFKYKVLTGTK